MEQLDMKSPKPEMMITTTNLEEKLSESRFQFALKCLQIFVLRKPTENVVFCPYSIYEGLLMVYFVSRDDTERHLKRILQLPNITKELLATYYKMERKKE
ncbi:serpin isoform a, partial [Lasius niger]